MNLSRVKKRDAAAIRFPQEHSNSGSMMGFEPDHIAHICEGAVESHWQRISCTH